MLLPALERIPRIVGTVVSAIALLGVGGILPAHAAPAAQLASTAPEILRCPGRPFPQPPGPDWQVIPVWDWRVVVDVEGTIGSNDGPYAVALDRNCNIYLTDSERFQILKLSP